MSGLLNMLNSEQGRIGLGLLGGSFGQQMRQGVESMDAYKKQQMIAQIQQLQMQKAQAEMADAQEQKKQQAAQAMQQQTNQGAIRKQIEGGGAFDPRAFLAANPGVDLAGVQQAMQMSKAMTPAQAEFSTTPQYDQNGNAFVMAKDGSMKRLDGVKSRDKLVETDLGGKKGFRSEYSPELVGSLDKTVSPDTAYSAGVTMRGQTMADARARDLNAIGQEGNRIKAGEKSAEQDKLKANQVASFDVMLGSLDRLGQHPGLSRSVGITGAFPTMPGSESANFKAELDTFQSQAFIPMVAQMKGMGALSDAEGKKLTAAVGALSPTMGEKAFRESVKRITDDMSAARSRLVGGGVTPGKQMESMPAANASNRGRKIRDTVTGKILVSNGMTWTEER